MRGKAEQPSESPGTAQAAGESTPRCLTQSQMVNTSQSAANATQRECQRANPLADSVAQTCLALAFSFTAQRPRTGGLRTDEHQDQPHVAYLFILLDRKQPRTTKFKSTALPSNTPTSTRSVPILCPYSMSCPCSFQVIS